MLLRTRASPPTDDITRGRHRRCFYIVSFDDFDESPRFCLHLALVPPSFFVPYEVEPSWPPPRSSSAAAARKLRRVWKWRRFGSSAGAAFTAACSRAVEDLPRRPTRPRNCPALFSDLVRGQTTQEESRSSVCYRLGAKSGLSARRTGHLRCLLLHELSTIRDADPTNILFLLHQAFRIPYAVEQRGRNPETRSAAECIARFGSQQYENRLHLLELLTTRHAASATSRLFSNCSLSCTMSEGVASVRNLGRLLSSVQDSVAATVSLSSFICICFPQLADLIPQSHSCTTTFLILYDVQHRRRRPEMPPAAEYCTESGHESQHLVLPPPSLLLSDSPSGVPKVWLVQQPFLISHVVDKRGNNPKTRRLLSWCKIWPRVVVISACLDLDDLSNTVSNHFLLQQPFLVLCEVE